MFSAVDLLRKCTTSGRMRKLETNIKHNYIAKSNNNSIQKEQ